MDRAVGCSVERGWASALNLLAAAANSRGSSASRLVHWGPTCCCALSCCHIGSTTARNVRHHTRASPLIAYHLVAHHRATSIQEPCKRGDPGSVLEGYRELPCDARDMHAAIPSTLLDEMHQAIKSL